MALIDSLEMLAMPGMSPPEERTALRRSPFIRPNSFRTYRRTRSWRMTGSAAAPVCRARSIRRSCIPGRLVGATDSAPSVFDASDLAASGFGLAPGARTKSPTRRSRFPATVPGVSRTPPDTPPEPSPARSWARVLLVTAHPLFFAPIMAEEATRASVRKVSLNKACPVISRSGLTSTPGWCMSRAK